MERKMKVTVRLSETELATLDLLCDGGSRDAYFRNLLAPMAEQEAPLRQASMNGLMEAAREAADRGENSAEYWKRIAKHESELAILHKAAP